MDGLRRRRRGACPGERSYTGVMVARRTDAPAPRPEYPAHWEADIALRDGTAAHLRPIVPSDAERLQRFHRAQSERSRYLRFFVSMPSLSAKDLERFTVVDHKDRVALIVLAQDDIIAVGRYDRIEGSEAEVAFNVADSQQGKGLGSVLLEHLVAAARECGIHTFVADVLPQNARMLSVFSDAGFDVRRHLDDGVVTIEFSIDPTARSLEVMAEREQRAEARAMETMLHPRSVMVVGVSSRADSMGGRVLRHLEDSGYEGEIHVVTRDAFEVAGRRAASHVTDVAGPVDLAVVTLIRPEACLEAVEDCGRIGVRSVLLPTDAFAALGPQGARLQRELVGRARRYGMRLLGPGSLGFLRTGKDPVNLSLSPRLPRPGHVGLAAQSTALSAMLLAGVDARGTGVHEFVTVGNRADVSLNDTLQHWQEDPEVSVVGLALESMGNPRKFTRIARRMTRTRPLVVLRPPGRGITAPPGHDVRPSSLPRRALDQALAASGVVATHDVDHLMDVIDALEREGVPHGDRVGLLSNTPALGEALRGAAAEAGLRVVLENSQVPLGTDERLVRRAFTSMAGLGDVDVVIAAIVDPLGGDLTETLRTIAAVARGSEVVLVMCVVTEQSRFEALRTVVRADPALPPVHTTPYAAVRAAAGTLAAADRTTETDPEPPVREDVDTDAARALVAEILADQDPSGVGVLAPDPDRTAQLLGYYGLQVMATRPVADVEEALAAANALGYPVALKSTDPVLRHRSDLGGVRLDIADDRQLRQAVQSMQRELAYSTAGLEVQAMAPPGVPVVVRSVEDPSLGPVVSFSLAGDANDLLGDIAYAIPPLTVGEAAGLIRTPASAARLAARDGLPAADLDSLAEVVVRLGLMAEDLPELHCLELYPVVVGHEGARIIAAQVQLTPAPNRTDGARRTLNASGA